MMRDCSLNSLKHTSSEHVVYKYCLECQNINKKLILYTTCSELVFFGEFNEHSLVIINKRRRASEKDLPVSREPEHVNISLWSEMIYEVSTKDFYCGSGPRTH